MVFGHNLRYMAPFDFSRAGFCMEFRRASFVLSCPGMDLGGPDRICGPPGRHFGLGALWGQFGGPEKTHLCEEMILWWGYRGIPSAQMNSMVPGIHLGVLVCPKTSLFNYFVGISSFPGKLQVAPVPSLLSLVVPLAAYFPLVGNLGCRKRLP